MQSVEGKPLHQAAKSKMLHSSAEMFEKTLKVDQKVLRDSFGWFCSAYLPNSINASGSAIIEPYHGETKQLTIILKGEYVSPHSRFKSVVVRQQFNMGLELSEARKPVQVLTATNSTEFLNNYNVEEVDITILEPKHEDKKKKKNSFVDNIARLAEHIQRFYVKNHFHWVTGANSTLVLAIKKRYGEVDCIFPTHFKHFEKCTFQGKTSVVVQQDSLQIDLIEDMKHLVEVKRHNKLFNRRKLREYSKLEKMLTPNYLKGKGKLTSECFKYSGESSDSEEEFYVIDDDSDSTSEEKFSFLHTDGIIVLCSGSDSDTEEEEIFDSKSEEGDSKVEVLESTSCVDSKTNSITQIKDDVCENVSKEEPKIEENNSQITVESCENENADKPKNEELELQKAGHITSFTLFLYLFDEEHGTIYRKYKWEPYIEENKIVAFRVPDNNQIFNLFILYDGTQRVTNISLYCHMEWFKGKTTLLQKANLEMTKLKRKIKWKLIKTSSGPRLFDNEHEKIKANAMNRNRFMNINPFDPRKSNLPCFGNREDRKGIALKKMIKSDESCSSVD